METIKTNTKTLELTGEEVHVHFTAGFPYFWLRNDGSEKVLMSLSPNISEGKDGVIEVLAGSSAGTMHGFNDTRSDLYLLGSGRAQIMATYTSENPFRKAQKGGEKKSISAAMGYVSDGLMCHYSADNDHFIKGWRIDDLSGNGNAGLFSVTTSSVYLYGSQNHIKLNTQSILMPEMNYEQITLEAVCKLPITPTSEVDIISNLESGGYAIYLNESKFLSIVRIDGIYYRTQGVTNDYQAHLLSVTYDNEHLKFYVDGELIDTVDVSGNIDFPENNTIMCINANPSGGGRPSNNLGIGSFDFCAARVYNKALTAEEIMKNFLVDSALFFDN